MFDRIPSFFTLPAIQIVKEQRAEYESWLMDLEDSIKHCEWEVVANSFCMIGVAWSSRIGQGNTWIDQNQRLWNAIVLELLNRYPEAKKQIKKYIRKDIKRYQEGKEGKIFGGETYAKFCLDFLS